ncbi:MAG: ROK family protein [Elusimicrobiota bacterium]|jgi:glucokinase
MIQSLPQAIAERWYNEKDFLTMLKGKPYSIGIDIGGTKILVALVDNAFRVISEIKAKTKPEKGDRDFLVCLFESVRHVLKDAAVDRDEVVGIGAGCPGLIDLKTGRVKTSPNIPFLKNYPLAQRIAALTKLPVVIGNDVQTGLFGEHQFGAARGYRHVVGLFMGTGIGGALILNGQIYSGSSGSAGEVGHLLVDPLGPPCGCGRRGCLEALAGRLAISAEVAIAVARQKAPHLDIKNSADLRGIKSGALAKAIQAGDRAIEELIRQKARLVGLVMANLVNTLNPEIIILGGGVVEAMPHLIVREAENAMREQALPALARTVKVTAAKLGDYSIVMGGAKRAVDRFGEKHRIDHPR